MGRCRRRGGARRPRAASDARAQTGLQFHVFASPHVLRAFPAYAETILGDGHDLDPLGEPTFGGALASHAPMGVALRVGEPYPGDLGLRFVSGSPALAPEVRARAVLGR